MILNDMEKNKATFKLKGIPQIYYINLDDKVDRRKYMEDQFEYWDIENYTRISACDGRDDDLSSILTGRYPENMTSGEIGCTTSHLKALKHWLENSDDEYLVMMEDDCDISTVRHWGLLGSNSSHNSHMILMSYNLQSLIHSKLASEFIVGLSMIFLLLVT